MNDLPVMIANNKVSCDENGLYSLNDLHKASGGEKRHEPNRWLRKQEVQEVIKKAEKDTPQKWVVTKEGKNGGTWVDRILLGMYASWISPEFHILVYKTFFETMDERFKKLEKEKAQLIEFKDDIYRKSIVDNYIGSKFPTLSEKVAKDVRVILRIIRNQGKEKFGYISFDNIIFASKTSHHEAWSYLRRTGALIEDGVCRFTKSPLYRLSDKTII